MYVWLFDTSPIWVFACVTSFVSLSLSVSQCPVSTSSTGPTSTCQRCRQWEWKHTLTCSTRPPSCLVYSILPLLLRVCVYVCPLSQALWLVYTFVCLIRQCRPFSLDWDCNGKVLKICRWSCVGTHLICLGRLIQCNAFLLCGSVACLTLYVDGTSTG